MLGPKGIVLEDSQDPSPHAAQVVTGRRGNSQLQDGGRGYAESHGSPRQRDLFTICREQPVHPGRSMSKLRAEE